MQINDRQYLKKNPYCSVLLCNSLLGLILVSFAASAAGAKGSSSPNSASHAGAGINKTAAKAKAKSSSKSVSAAGRLQHTAAENAVSSNNSQAVSNISDAAVSEMKEHAAELEKSGKLEEAQQLLTKVTELRPDDKAAFNRLSDIAVIRAQEALKANKFDVALLATRQALSARPNNQQANQILAKLYLQVGADPNDVSNRLKTADALLRQGRLHEAEVEYQASLAVKLTPDAYVGLGKVADRLQEPGAGRPDYERALEVDSNSSAAHREMGRLYLSNGDVVGANSELSRALILNSSDKEAGDALTKLWHEQVNLKPDANSHLGLARAYQLQGDLSAAQSEYKEVVRIDPKNPALPAARQSFKIALAKTEASKDMSDARLLEAQGRLMDAYNKASTAVGYSPDNSEYMLYQGQILEKLGQLPTARQVYLKILEFDPQNTIAVQRIKQMPSQYSSGQQIIAGQPIANARTQLSGFPGSKFPFEENASSNTAAANSNQLGVLSSFVGQVRNTMMGKQGSGLNDDAPASAKGGRAAMAAVTPSPSQALVGPPVPIPISDGPSASASIPVASAPAASSYSGAGAASSGATPAASDEFLASMLVEPVPFSVPAQPLAVGAHSKNSAQTNHSIAWARSRNSRKAPSSVLSIRRGGSSQHTSASSTAANMPRQPVTANDTAGGSGIGAPVQDASASAPESTEASQASQSAAPHAAPPPKADPGGLFAGSEFN